MNMGRFPPPGTLAATYARFSTDLQNPKSADDQAAMLRTIAEKNSWPVVLSAKDEGKSGSRGDRAGFLRIAEAAQNGEFSVLMVEGLERLSRSRADLFALHDNILKPKGINIYVARGNAIIDDMAMMLLSWKAQEDLVQLKQQVERGHASALKDKRLLGSISYGYEKAFDGTGKNGLRKISEAEAKVVRRIFQEFDAGRSPLQIAAGLNADGIPSSRGKTWNPGVILGNAGYGSGILRNRLYNGEFVFRRTMRELDSKRANKAFTKPGDKAKQAVVLKPELAIISPPLFAAVQDRLAEGQVRGKPEIHTRRKPEYLFSGKISCGVCGENYNVLSGSLGCVGRALKGNGCTNKRRTKREDLEAAVLRGLEHRLLQPDLLAPVVAEYRAEAERALADQVQQIARATCRVKELASQSKNLRSQLALMDAASKSAAMLRQDLDQVANDLEGAERLARQVERELPSPKSAEEIIEVLKRAVPNLQKLLNQPDVEAVRAREKLRALFDEIIVQPYDDGHHDGRGAGPVVATVVGWLGRLLEIADDPVGRVSLSRSGTTTTQEHANLQFFYSVVIANEKSENAERVAADARWVLQLLEKAPDPLRHQDLLAAFGRERESSDVKNRDRRVRRALERLTARHRIMRVTRGREVAYFDSAQQDRANAGPTLNAMPAIFVCRQWLPQIARLIGRRTPTSST